MREAATATKRGGWSDSETCSSPTRAKRGERPYKSGEKNGNYFAYDYDS